MSNEGLLKRAAEFAEATYKDKTRLNGDSYFLHATRVVNLLKKIKIHDETVLALAMLHHIPEFSHTSNEQLKNLFGDDLLTLLLDFQKLKKEEVKKIHPKDINSDVILRTFLNLAEDYRLLLVRMADKIENLKTSHVLPQEKRKQTAEKALYLYSPVCHLMSLSKFIGLIENESFKISEPSSFYLIQKQKETFMSKNKRRFLDFDKFLKAILKEESVTARVDNRIKSNYSIFKKLQKKKLEVGDIRKVLDLVAYRIMVDTVDECYKVEELLKRAFDHLPAEHTDYIATPKPFGYRSIHDSFRLSPSLVIEVQIRTHEMHEFNEYGPASHSLYKIGKDLAKRLLKDPEWLKNLEYTRYEEHKEQKIHKENDHVYVFSPKADIFELPIGATALDYAYYVHQDVGNKCVQVSVNGAMQKLNYVLQDGDTVLITTSGKESGVSYDRLKLVRTKRAKDYIRKVLNST